MTDTKQKIDELATEWLRLKGVEEDAKDERLDVEAQMIELLGVREEGSKSHRGELFRVTTRGAIYRRVNADKWAAIVDQVPEELRAVVEYKPAVSTRGYKYIAKHRPDVLGLISEAITETPGKPGISVAEIKGAKK